MAKKKPVELEPAGKVSIMLRLDAEVHAKLKQLTDAAQISINQFVGGMCRWAVENAHQGEPMRDGNGVLYSKEQAGCIWLGTRGCRNDEETRAWLASNFGGDPKGYEFAQGDCWLALDFTDRRVIVENDEKNVRGSQSKKYRS